MICGVVYGAESYTIEGIKLLDYREVGIIIGAVLAVGVLITLLFSAFAVNKFVNMKSNKIYLY
jgi:cell division transport system permease protein